MFTNLFTANTVNNIATVIPATTIIPAIMPICVSCAEMPASGILASSPYSAAAKSAVAIAPAHRPCLALVPMKGFIMNYLVAPTSFIVLIIWRRE